MPEELRHLCQRAGGQSASYNVDDKATPPHAWQMCPCDRQLGGTGRQRGIRSFTDSTVQYIVDCSHLQSSHPVHVADGIFCSRPGATAVYYTSDLTGCSPPRKRPHFDQVDFSSFVYFAC